MNCQWIIREGCNDYRHCKREGNHAFDFKGETMKLCSQHLHLAESFLATIMRED